MKFGSEGVFDSFSDKESGKGLGRFSNGWQLIRQIAKSGEMFQDAPADAFLVCNSKQIEANFENWTKAFGNVKPIFGKKAQDCTIINQ